MALVLSIFQENVPVIDCTVEQFIIGIIALFLVSAFGFWFWNKLKGAVG